MLHTNFRGNRPAGSGEDFLRVFTIYGRRNDLDLQYSHTFIYSIR